MSKKKPVPEVSPLILALPQTGVDVHAHLDMHHFDADRDAVIDHARKAGVAHIGNVFLEPENFMERRAIFANHPEVFFLLGLHPCDGQKCTSEALNIIEEAFKIDNRLRAVGETGLDYHWQDCPKDIQKNAFIAQIKLARKLDVPLCIHCRDATEDTLDILENHNLKDYKILWHCFGGNKDLAERIVQNGWHVSIPGPVSYPANNALREAVASIPLEYLLIETDCPYLAPLEWRGKRNEPSFAVFTAACIAKERGMDIAELWTICGENAKKFFSL